MINWLAQKIAFRRTLRVLKKYEYAEKAFAAGYKQCEEDTAREFRMCPPAGKSYELWAFEQWLADQGKLLS